MDNPPVKNEGSHKMPNIYQVAMFNAERYPDKVAISDGSQALSFAQFCQRARALAHYLASLGVGPGERVAIMTPNSIDYLALLHATALWCRSIPATAWPNWPT
jgi:acyl-CoA synthetase (AMP-forming)/AMP-acid ligase II